MASGVFFEPDYFSVPGQTSSQAQSNTPEHHASEKREVTCNANCQVTFGPHSDSDTPSSGEGPPKADSSSNANGQSLNGLDLEAQRRMAHWAMLLAGLTATGLVLLAGTLWEAAEATRAANAAAVASHKTADVTRDIGVKQARAYVGVERAEYEVYPNYLFFRLFLKNYGNSPATYCEAQATLEVVKYKVSAGENAFSESLARDIEYQQVISSGKFSPVGSVVAGGPGECLMTFSRRKSLAWENEAINDFCSGLAEGSFRINLKWIDVFEESIEAYVILYDKPEEPAKPKSPLVEAMTPKKKILLSRALIMSEAKPAGADNNGEST
jgi:hypothetical protein